MEATYMDVNCGSCARKLADLSYELFEIKGIEQKKKRRDRTSRLDSKRRAGIVAAGRRRARRNAVPFCHCFICTTQLHNNEKTIESDTMARDCSFSQPYFGGSRERLTRRQAARLQALRRGAPSSPLAPACFC